MVANTAFRTIPCGLVAFRLSLSLGPESSDREMPHDVASESREYRYRTWYSNFEGLSKLKAG